MPEKITCLCGFLAAVCVVASGANGAEEYRRCWKVEALVVREVRPCRLRRPGALVRDFMMCERIAPNPFLPWLLVLVWSS